MRVDGREWKKGQPATGLADTARALYGARHEEFLENLKAFAYFPIAAARDVDDFHGGEISMTLPPSGRATRPVRGDSLRPQAERGLPDGALQPEGHERGALDVQQRGAQVRKKGPEDVTLSLKTWHTLKIVVNGTSLEGWLDGKKYLEYTLAAPVSGKVGLWSKTDSVSDFADFAVTR